MKPELPTAASQGRGRCYSLAPGILDADEQGHSILVAADVSAEHKIVAMQAVQSCPEQAISFHD
jgi:ferredoxin